jgi:predicted MFS family arabinose efflux permease
VQLAGPPLGGALFSAARALPFLADVVSYACSSVSLLTMRTPFQQVRENDTTPWRSRLGEGFSFLWREPFLRTCALIYALGNLIGPGILFAVVVIGKRHGLSSTSIGVVLAAFGLAGVVGSFLAPTIRRLLPVRGVLLLELWAWPGTLAFLVHPTPYVLAAGIVPAALCVASTDSVVHAYRLAMTPDRLVGRVESVRSMLSLSIAPLGPLLAGVLLDHSERATIGVLGMLAVVLALWGSTSPAIRTAPDLAELGRDLGGSDEREASQT